MAVGECGHLKKCNDWQLARIDFSFAPLPQIKSSQSLNESASDGFEIGHSFDSGLLEGLPLG
jgi:hypothetical protein